MRIEKMASKSDVTVKLVLVFFISLLSFSIGTFVGKKYSDNQHQLAQLEPGKTTREVASVETEKGETKTASMSDEEIAKLAEEFVSDENETPAKGEEEHKTAEHKAVEHKANEHEAVATAEHGVTKKEIAKEETRTETPRTQRAPSSLPKNAAQYTVGKFTVQVASYNEEGEAQKMASELKQKGYSAFYVPATVKGKTWYRVSVGQFATPKEAQSYRSELMEKAKVNSAIVQKITE